jgi:hypothetical protein
MTNAIVSLDAADARKERRRRSSGRWWMTPQAVTPATWLLRM